jgi:hypothetical protein
MPQAQESESDMGTLIALRLVWLFCGESTTSTAIDGSELETSRCGSLRYDENTFVLLITQRHETKVQTQDERCLT